MTVNESFLDSATLRENVVSLARNIGYVPKSRTAAQATVSFDVTTSGNTPSLTLQAGLVCVGIIMIRLTYFQYQSQLQQPQLKHQTQVVT